MGLIILFSLFLSWNVDDILNRGLQCIMVDIIMKTGIKTKGIQREFARTSKINPLSSCVLNDISQWSGKTYSQMLAAGPWKTSFLSTSFRYNIDEVPKALNPCLYQLACDKVVSLFRVSLKVTEPNDDIKWGLTVQYKVGNSKNSRGASHTKPPEFRGWPQRFPASLSA